MIRTSCVEEASAAEGGGESPEANGLLLEGEEQEYFLELLMRKESPEQPKPSLPEKSKATTSKGKKGRSKEKKVRGRSPAGRSASEGTREKGQEAWPTA
jgi:hypothetical protein